ncbi:purine nucleoside phosphorylase [Caulobacter ginsengisoli]|uniref:Purine nucleoside phosphorylase n=1 Tax=Caulobacter ginsengisoli TaxID=400775 RepID=A0ABU0ILD3_9CAUL|nr:hypothetical protein [Caulobacter ginsengisoli]MDQ0462815.1 purine nucleoside phosphorylase [Caulobacter ginsengisoli]
MSDPTIVDPQVVDAINQVQQATMAPQVVLTSGAGKAYQMVAQACAMAVQDATDALRNINTISATAIGVAMAQLLETGDPRYVAVLAEAQKLLVDANANFAATGEAAAAVLKSFPSG